MNSIESLREDIEKLQTHKNNGQGYITGFHRCKKEALKVIDNLEHLGKPEIPDYVAEFIKGPLKKGTPERVNSKEDMIHVIMRYGYGESLNVDTLYKKEEYKVKYNKDRELADYISFNKETVIRAILDGFTIEVKKYSVAVDHDNGDWTYASDGRSIFKTRFKSDATQLAKLLGGRVIRYEEGE